MCHRWAAIEGSRKIHPPSHSSISRPFQTYFELKWSPNGIIWFFDFSSFFFWNFLLPVGYERKTSTPLIWLLAQRPLMFRYLLQLHIQNPHMCCMRLIKKPNLLIASSMSARRSMTSSTTERASSHGGSQRNGEHWFLRREEWSRWISVATHLFHLDPQHQFF